MYSKDFKRLALRKMSEIGVIKASELMHVHRSTIWRWRKNALDTNKKAKTVRMNRIFDKVKDFIQ